MGAMSRRKGATAERAVVSYLRSLGVPADRTSRGADVHGMGDIDGIPGVVIEVKAAKSPAPATWLDQLDAEMTAARAPRGVILWKPPGVAMSAVGLWLAVSPMGHPVRRPCPGDALAQRGRPRAVRDAGGGGPVRVRARGRPVGSGGTPCRAYRHRSFPAPLVSVWAALAWWVALSIPIGITLGRAIDRHHHQEETE
jgi:hypothetical protein